MLELTEADVEFLRDGLLREQAGRPVQLVGNRDQRPLERLESIGLIVSFGSSVDCVSFSLTDLGRSCLK
jgi:hypothetical protein